MDEINQGIDNLDQATQANAASAEELAACADQSSSQAVALRQTVSRFKFKAGQETRLASEPTPMSTPHAMPNPPSLVPEEQTFVSATPDREVHVPAEEPLYFDDEDLLDSF